MNTAIIVLRLIHVFSAIFWVGSALTTGFFISPAVRVTAEAGQKFMGYLVTQTRLIMAITVSAVLTVLAGISLYWIDSDGLTSAWMKSGAGIGFGIGGLAGIISLIVGVIFGKNISALGSIFSQIQGKPTGEQISKLQAIQKSMAVLGPANTIAQVIAVLCMATARYWHL